MLVLRKGHMRLSEKAAVCPQQKSVGTLVWKFYSPELLRNLFVVNATQSVVFCYGNLSGLI